MMTQHDLEKCIPEIRARVLFMLNGDTEALSGACLYHAVAAHQMLGAPIVAGSYSWKFTSFDDGNNATHFSSMFDYRAQVHAQSILSKPEALSELFVLPEMHVWNMFQGKVLDLSTLHVPDFAIKAGGFVFESTLTPPEYIWDQPKHKKGRWLYGSHPLATKLANAAAQNTIRTFPLSIEGASHV